VQRSGRRGYQRLVEMDKKGLITGIQKRGRHQVYGPSICVGSGGQVNKLSRELIEDFEEYFPSLAEPGLAQDPQLRTIPVRRVSPFNRGDAL